MLFLLEVKGKKFFLLAIGAAVLLVSCGTPLVSWAQVGATSAETEKGEIFRQIGGSKAVQFNFSDSEKRAIIKALNK
jgi:hypothetical protein